MLSKTKTGSTFGSTLLICGITIGVGMLGLPVATAKAGFWPSLFAYFICWVFMLGTGLLVLEACLYCPKDSNLITLTRHLLGKGGSALCWVLYLFLFTCLMVAHFAAAGQIISSITNGGLSYWQSATLFLVILWPIIGYGTGVVDKVNSLLMCVLAVTFILFVILSIKHIQPSLLSAHNWLHSMLAIPVIFTSFGYQTLIPTLLRYTQGNVKKVRRSIFFGTFIPFAIYVVWQLIISGVVPYSILETANAQGISAVTPLSKILNTPLIATLGTSFAMVTMVTSYFGISIGFIDFLADGLRVPHRGMARFWICCGIFFVPLGISLYNPGLFLKALGVAGGFGVALLLGLLPIAMIWNARYRKRENQTHVQLGGGKGLLTVMLLFTLLVILLELL